MDDDQFRHWEGQQRQQSDFHREWGQQLERERDSWSAGTGAAAGGPGAGASGSVFDVLAMCGGLIGAFLGLLLGRDQWLAGIVVFALIGSIPFILLKYAVRGLGWAVGSGARGIAHLGGVPGWILRGGVIGAAAGAGLAAFVGGVPLMEGVARLGPIGAIAGGVLRVLWVAVRR